MLAGFYTAASGLLTQQRNINVIGNNMTNSQTVGYRSQRVMQSTFEHDYLTRYEDGVYNYIGTGDPVTLIDEVETNFNYSSLEDTDSPFDMAIVGDGYFNIQGETRQYMTRNGNFNIDDEGYLILEDVGRVLGQNGNIRVNGSKFTVTTDGYVFDENYNFIDRLLITRPAEGSQLRKYPNGMFSTDRANVINAPDVYQYTLERSNVDMNQEYTRLIEAQRCLQACATALSTVDNMNAKAATISSIT